MAGTVSSAHRGFQHPGARLLCPRPYPLGHEQLLRLRARMCVGHRDALTRQAGAPTGILYHSHTGRCARQLVTPSLGQLTAQGFLPSGADTTAPFIFTLYEELGLQRHFSLLAAHRASCWLWGPWCGG